MGYVPLAHGSLSPDPCLYQTSQKPLWFPVFAPHPTHAACLLTLFLCWNRASLAKDSFLLAMMAPIQSLKKLRRFSNMLLTQWSSTRLLLWKMTRKTRLAVRPLERMRVSTLSAPGVLWDMQSKWRTRSELSTIFCSSFFTDFSSWTRLIYAISWKRP